ncbi:MAG: NUDIX hydrolase [Bacilli bacterium]|nr:NUDIX hydrolase [Bacilli bacterium]
MITLNKKIKEVNSERRACYAILETSDEKIAVVRHTDWGLIFLGGKKEKNEIAEETIKREVQEEIGYSVDSLEFYETIETYYDIVSKGKKLYCHNIADIYTGKIKDKVQEPIEPDTTLEMYYPNELFGKMKLEFQNVILEKLYKK